MRESQKLEARSQKSEAVGSVWSAGHLVSQSPEVSKGGKTMGKLVKKVAGLLVGVVGLVMGGVMVERAYAYTDAISTNNATALTVRVTPNVDRGVEISSGGVSLNLGTVDLGASTKTVSPATVTILGNVATTELNMTSTVTATTAGEDSWDFDNDPTSADTDLLASWVIFSSVTYSGVPSDNDFQISNATVTQAMAPLSGAGERIGGQNGNGTRFELGSTDMDSMAPATRRGMWVRMRLPSATTPTGAQDVTYQLNVVGTNY